MKAIRLFAGALTASLFLAACTSAVTPEQQEARLKEVTAGALGGVTPGDIIVSQRAQGAAKVSWRAEAKGKAYACDADELLRLPSCREVS